MANIDKMFEFIASKLDMDDALVLQKSKEFYRLLQNKGSFTNINDIGKFVLCMDVATSLLCHTFDKVIALKLSGLKKSVYQNTLHNIEKILNLDKDLTISELCVQLSCTEIKDFAEQIWSKYKEKHPTLNDNNHPLYIVVTVYMACKLRKIKIDKPKLISLSRSTASQFKELENDFQKFTKSVGMLTEKTIKKGTKTADLENIEDLVNDINLLSFKSPKKKIEAESVEDYETWKKRILEEAYEALKSKKA